jgi:hypothetical protein
MQEPRTTSREAAPRFCRGVPVVDLLPHVPTPQALLTSRIIRAVVRGVLAASVLGYAYLGWSNMQTQVRYEDELTATQRATAELRDIVGLAADLTIQIEEALAAQEVPNRDYAFLTGQPDNVSAVVGAVLSTAVPGVTVGTVETADAGQVTLTLQATSHSAALAWRSAIVASPAVDRVSRFDAGTGTTGVTYAVTLAAAEPGV